jgi:hypothetical protein
MKVMQNQQKSMQSDEKDAEPKEVDHDASAATDSKAAKKHA